MPQIVARKAQQEEVKTLIESQIDYTSYYKTIPDGSKFLRFASLPKDIVYEFVVKDLDFYLEHDSKFKR